jgi:hypothetical protein
MIIPDNELPDHERRRYPRYYVTSHLTMAIEDKSLRESIGIGEPGDISMGGVRVKNLPSCPSVKVGAQLVLLLFDAEDALSLQGEVVHHGTHNTFGVVFRELSQTDEVAVANLIGRLHARL